jgi:hypothetical protein
LPGEEFSLQVASILDIAGRLHAFGLPTYVGTNDLRKAYDTTPHEMLFSKIEANGIMEHMLSLLKTLYRELGIRPSK